MKILLTNDDGIYAPGLWALYTALAADHDVSVIAPDRERSAVGHGITLNEPLRLTWVEVNGACSGYAVTGTPVDCVKLGLAEILKDRPDMVISGINAGANVGMDINYSGTVSAAREAAVFGIPAIAVSVQHGGDTSSEASARFVVTLAENVREKGLPPGTRCSMSTFQMCPLSRRRASGSVVRGCLRFPNGSKNGSIPGSVSTIGRVATQK